MVTGHSWVNRTPNMDVSVLGTWNTCNSGLMTRADKLWACIVQRRFKRLAQRGRCSLLYGLMPRDIHKIFPPSCPGGPRNPRRRRGRSRIGTYVPFLYTPNRSATPRLARFAKAPAARSTTRLASPCAFRLTALLTVLPTFDTTLGICKAPPY